jgi:hypothetical protein
MQPFLYLGGIGHLKEPFKRLDEIESRLLDRVPLTGNIQFRAERDVPISFALYNRRQLMYSVHVMHLTLTFYHKPTMPGLL